MFGGSADSFIGSWEKQSKLADTTLLQFCKYMSMFLHDSTCMCKDTVFRYLTDHYHCDNEPSHVPLVLSCSVTYMYMSVSLIFSSTNVGCSGQSEWELCSVTPFSQLGSEERVSVKKIQREERERQVERRAQRAEERVQRAEERARRAEERVQQDGGMGEREQLLEARADELQRRLDEKRRECEMLAAQLEERENVLQHTEERAQQAEERVQQERERVQRPEARAQEAEMRVQRAEETVQEEMERVQRAEERAQQAEEREQRDREALGQRVQQAEARAAELQRRLDEVEGREQERLTVQQQAIAAEQRGPSWEVGEGDIQLTGEVIGIGGWAEVRVAHLKVAAKKLHRQLVYDYHRQLFQREMAVAARVSHPNLLRFHGAKLEGGMAILTELMPTSLRDEVERGHRHPEHRLSWEHILSIAMDVACALNYLHHLIPDPIIHRDLSSANVLLKPTPNGGWLAKVSDYGSANFQQRLQTQNPGGPVYAAPESHNPALQSPKMDMYSFGVLLIEMCTSEFPAPERCPDLIESIRYPQLVRLIRWCLNEDQNQRPTTAQVIDYLHTL